MLSLKTAPVLFAIGYVLGMLDYMINGDLMNPLSYIAFALVGLGIVLEIIGESNI